MMKIGVIGLGSMGKRRIRLIKKILPKSRICGVDNNIIRGKEAKEEFNLFKVYNNSDDLIKNENIDILIISSSPLTHNKLVINALEKNINTFSELNLNSEGYEKIIKLSKEKKVIAFLSSTILYRKEIQYFKKNLDLDNLFYRYHVGQYLPDWHPWESFKDFFVNNKESNGCRELMAIEFPWIFDLFGEIKSFKVNKNKISNLDIKYPDTFQILFEHLNGIIGSITIDILSRKAERNLQIFSEIFQIEWEGTPENLYSFDIEKGEYKKINLYENIIREEGYSNNIVENAYEDELRCFFESIEKKENLGLYSYKKDEKILSLIDKIEEINNE